MLFSFNYRSSIHKQFLAQSRFVVENILCGHLFSVAKSYLASSKIQKYFVM